MCALLACAALFATAGILPRTASADDWSDPAGAAQTSSSSSSSSAVNDSSTVQRSTQTQTGAGQQSQTTIQSAPTEQTANAASRSSQSAANVSHGGAAQQQNNASSAAVARNVNETNQSSAQKQAGDGPPPPDPAPSPAQSQSTSQSAPTTQHADATATSKQVAPTNINISIRIDSPGDNGPVNQVNTSTASAVSDNANTVTQDANQAQSGSSGSGGQSQSATQDAPTTQLASSTSTSNQVAPTNINITIRNKSPGENGAVTQTNASNSTAAASNTNGSSQGAGQAQSESGKSAPSILGGNGSPHSYVPRGHTSYPPAPSQPAPAGSTQSQVTTQSAPTTETGNATATSVQDAPANSDVAVAISDGASDPSGSGRRGTLIQVWIPTGSATQTNSSQANAGAVNSNQTTQAADQRQTAPSGGATQLGGAGQTQIVQQSAPTTQGATADATSLQSGAVNVANGGAALQTNTSLGKATVDNLNETTQSAQQIQDGGSGVGGSQLQIVEQFAPAEQLAIAQALSTLTDPTNVGGGGWSLATNISSATVSAGKSNQTTQSVEQIQMGMSDGEAQIQVIEQRAANAARAHTQRQCKRTCASSTSAAVTLEQDATIWSRSEDRDQSSRSRESGASKEKKQGAPRDGRLPRAPEFPGAAAGASSGGGGGPIWVFAALLIPFALTASWWARHYGPSAFRRLAGVVVRPERPG
jgi:hypothetical protein